MSFVEMRIGFIKDENHIYIYIWFREGLQIMNIYDQTIKDGEMKSSPVKK